MLFAAKVFLWFVIYSFLGWAYESVLCSVTSRSLVNRGFLNGPFCPVYGFGALVVVLAFWNEPDISFWNLFFSGMVLTCSLEYFTSWAMEKLFHARWWDYSSHRFNLNGRICLAGGIVFGAFSVFLVKWLHPRVAAFVDRFSPEAILWSAGGLLLILAADCFITVRHILALNGRLAEIQAALDEYKARSRSRAEALRASLQARLEEGLPADLLDELKDRRPVVSLEALKDRLEERFEESRMNSPRIQSLLDMRKFQDRRLLKAFPRLSSTRYGDALEKFRERLAQEKEARKSKKKD